MKFFTFEAWSALNIQVVLVGGCVIFIIGTVGYCFFPNWWPQKRDRESLPEHIVTLVVPTVLGGGVGYLFVYAIFYQQSDTTVLPDDANFFLEFFLYVKGNPLASMLLGFFSTFLAATNHHCAQVQENRHMGHTMAVFICSIILTILIIPIWRISLSDISIVLGSAGKGLSFGLYWAWYYNRLQKKVKNTSESATIQSESNTPAKPITNTSTVSFRTEPLTNEELSDLDEAVDFEIEPEGYNNQQVQTPPTLAKV